MSMNSGSLSSLLDFRTGEEYQVNRLLSQHLKIIVFNPTGESDITDRRHY